MTKCLIYILLFFSVHSSAQVFCGYAGMITPSCTPPASITGTLVACAGSTSQLSDATAGGAWSSSATAVATVGTAGLVTGVASGTATITYATTSICRAVATFTVNATPVSITGTLSACAGTTSQLTNTTAGGTWSSATTSVATIGTAGLVTAAAAGTSTIGYTLSTGCAASSTFTVNANPAAISGTLTVSTSATTQLTDATAGGTWSSSATAIATIGTAGLVTGVSAGTSIISYTLTTGCYATAVVTVTSGAATNAFDPAKKGTNIVLSNSNLTATSNTSTWGSVFGLAAFAHSIGLYYCEYLCTVSGGGNTPMFGIGNASSPTGNFCGSDANGWGYFGTTYYNNGGATGLTPPNFVFGDRIMMAVNLNNGKVWFGVNGTWNNSGNPAAGTNQAFTIPTSVTYYPIVSCFYTTALGTANFGGSAYTYTPPSGFGNW